MGPLSGVAVAFWLAIFNMTAAGWITASPHFYGVLGVIVAVVIILDCFWVHSAARYHAWRNP